MKIKLSPRGRGAAVYLHDYDGADIEAWAVRVAARGEPPWMVEIVGVEGYRKIVVVP